MTGSDNKRLVRPTFRCLLDDLAQDVGPEKVRVALRSATQDRAVDPTYLLPCSLVDIDHTILDKANLIASDEAAHRERIVAIADRHAIKVKTGDRRAALWQDDAGTWWLLAAGRRKDDGSGDLYRQLERFAKDSSPIAPTEADERYRRLEAAYAAECEDERSAHSRVLGGLLAAARVPGSAIDIEVFGAAVSIRVVPDEDGLAVLEMSWEFSQFDQKDRFPMDVLAMVPRRESLDEWEYQPPRKDDDLPHSWFAYVTEEWVEHMATSAELDDLLTNGDTWTPVNPSSDGSEHFSHLAKGSVVTLAYATGIEIVGLCGASVVAHRDYEKFPICPSCQENLELLHQLRGSPEP